MNWIRFDERKPDKPGEIVITDENLTGFMRGMYDWFPNAHEWPEKTNNLYPLYGNWVSEPFYWVTIETFVSELRSLFSKNLP